MSHPADIEKSRKRRYRQRVVCENCGKEIDSDYKDGHAKKVHKGEKVKFKVVVDANQSQLSNFFIGSSKPEKHQTLEPRETARSESVFAAPISSFNQTLFNIACIEDAENRPSFVSLVADSTHSRSESPSVSTFKELEDSIPNHSSTISSSVQKECASSHSSTTPTTVQDPEEDISSSRHSSIISDVQDQGEDCASSHSSTTPTNVQDPEEDFTHSGKSSTTPQMYAVHRSNQF